MNLLSYWKYLLLLVILVTASLLRLHTLGEPLQGDLTTYGYIAHNMLDGKLLYTYLWDHKPPGIYWAYMLAELMWGYGQHAIVYLGIVFSVLAIVFLYLFLGRITGPSVALLGTAFYGLASNSVALEANEPNVELFLNALIIMSTWGFVLWSEKGKNGYLCLSGTFLALATLFKTVAVFPLFFLCIYILLPFSIDNVNRWLRDRTGKLFWFLAPCALLWLATFCYFGVNGRFLDFWNAVFAYNADYVNSKGSLLEHVWTFFSTPNLLFHARLKDVWILVLLSIAWVSFSREKYSNLRRSFFVFLSLGLCVAVSSPGRYYSHYYQLFLPILSVLPALFFHDVSERMKQSKGRYGKAAIIGLMYLTLILLGRYQVQYLAMTPFEISEEKYGKKFVQAYQIAQVVKHMTKPCDSIYEWGAETSIYYYSKRKSATGLVYIYPLFTGPKEDRTKRVQRILDDIVSSMPAVIIYNEAYGINLEESFFAQLIQDKYKLVNKIAPYLIFEANPREPCEGDKSLDFLGQQ